jgi:hypothetical protein
VAAAPAGGTSARGTATPTTALARATTAVSGGDVARGRGGGSIGGPGGRSAGGLPPGRRLCASGGAVEGRGRRGSLVRHGELLEEKLIPHRMEGGKGLSPLDESLQVTVAGAEVTQEVQHQGAVRHRLAEITEGVRQALHLAAVLPHVEIPLGELVELGVEVQGASVPVPEELFLEGEPRLTARVRLVADDVLELDGYSSVEPGEDHFVHQGPGQGRRPSTSSRTWSSRA